MESSPVVHPPRRRRLGIVVAFVIGLLVIPTIALANHQFSDVPTGAIYHDDVEALADAGVARGCTASTFCPNNTVTRWQMALFLNRGLGRATSSFGQILVSEAEESFVATISIPAGAEPGGTGYVTVTADLTWFGSASSCPCGITFGIASLLSKGDVSPTTLFIVPADAVNGFGANAASMSWTFEVPTGQDAEYGLFASSATNPVVLGEPGTTGVGDIFQGTMTAQYSPLGSVPGLETLSGDVVDGAFGPINLEGLRD